MGLCVFEGRVSVSFVFFFRQEHEIRCRYTSVTQGKNEAWDLKKATFDISGARLRVLPAAVLNDHDGHTVLILNLQSPFTA